MENFKNNLEKSILATIAYFDVFDYTMTVAEIWKWLWAENSEAIEISEIKNLLEESEFLKSLVGNGRGFYYLKGKEKLAELRQKRYNLAEKKLRKARRAVRFLGLMPGVKMIAVCNSLSWANASEGSDIDLFVVTARNKIWTSRFWTAGFLALLGLRPKKNKTRDKICLSFFVDEDSLDLRPLAIGESDIYLMYWVSQLMPLYDKDGVYQKFWISNTWVNNFLPNIFPREQVVVAKKNNSAGRSGFGEKFFRWLQIKMMPANLKEMANRDSRVVVTDKILKFHANDRREEYKQKWIKRTHELGI